MSKTFYRHRLPHIQPEGFCFFVTFRLADSIPKIKLKHLQDSYYNALQQINIHEDGIGKNILILELRKKYLIKYDELLDQIKSGKHYLKRDEIASIVAEQIERFDGTYYDLLAYCIMSNHVHLLIDCSVQIKSNDFDESYTQLDQIMHRIKGASSRFCNQALHKTGKFWEHESYDIYIRDEKMLQNVISYILENPVKDKIVNHWRDYKWTYVKDEDAY